MGEDNIEQVLQIIGEKWVVSFTDVEGLNGGYCNDHTKLPELVKTIRAMGGKNIVLTDKTPFYYEPKENCATTE